MLPVLFGLSLCVIIASIIRRPRQTWQKGLLLLAVVMFLAVCVAWTIEFVLQHA